MSKDTKSLLSSRETAMKLAKIADRFGLDEKQKSLQARILAKVLLGEIKIAELGRVLRINLNLDEKRSEDLSAAISQDFFAPEKKEAVSVNIAKSAQAPELKAEIAPNLLKQSAGALADFIDGLINDLRLELSDLQKSRLESSVLTYVKDIRDLLETEESLERPAERGGAGLSEELAKRIGEQMQKAFPEENKAGFLGQTKKSSSIFNFAPELEANFYPAPPAEIKEKNQEAPVAALKTPEPLPAKMKVMNDVLPQEKVIPPEQITQSKGLKIEEINDAGDLSKLALENFKTSKPDEATRRIVARVASLVGKNEVGRLQSIEAWRDSTPYKLYIAIGEESIAQGKTITEIASARMLQSLPYLTEEEFNAIADASREFQY
ncbi:MAG: hypothetical protein Q8N68_03135 [bacterium]|nr:hypothetical protein [bacterium]